MTASSPYRDLARRPAGAALAHQLRYHPCARPRQLALEVCGWLLALGALAALTSAPLVSVVLLGVWLGWRVVRRAQQHANPAVLLTVADGELRVTRRRHDERLPLDALHAVELETRVVEKSYADRVVGDAVVSLGVRPPMDVARLVLVADGRRLPLSRDLEPSSQALEQLGRIRRFLRSHGWQPAAERDELI